MSRFQEGRDEFAVEWRRRNPRYEWRAWFYDVGHEFRCIAKLEHSMLAAMASRLCYLAAWVLLRVAS